MHRRRQALMRAAEAAAKGAGINHHRHAFSSGTYLAATRIRRRHVFGGGTYLVAARIRQQHVFGGGTYSAAQAYIIKNIMEQITALFIEWGYAGIFLSAFIAGSIVPFSSEAVMIILAQSGLAPWPCIIWATAGNTLGGITCYELGCLGKRQWIERWLGMKPERLDKAQRFLGGRGAVMALFVVLPYIGDAIAVVLGFMRSNRVITYTAMAVGKLVRYIAIMYAAEGVVNLFTN